LNGASVPSSPNAYSTVTLTDSYPVFNFTIVDESSNFDGAITTYIVEEGKMVKGEFVPLGDDSNDEAWEELEVVKDNSGNLVFSIGSSLAESRDTGLFRIKTINRYKGTAQTAYTGAFLVSRMD